MVVEKSCDTWVGVESDRATLAAVSAVRAGKWLELFAFYGGAAIAAVTCAQVKSHLINESDHLNLLLPLKTVKGEPSGSPPTESC